MFAADFMGGIMRRTQLLPVLCSLFLACSFCALAVAAEQDTGSEAACSTGEIQGAVARSLDLLEKASMGSAEKRVCFTCHSQAMPVLALAEAK